MKKDKFADINRTKKNGKGFVIFVAVAAICLAGVLCAVRLRTESNSVFLETGNVEFVTEESI